MAMSGKQTAKRDGGGGGGGSGGGGGGGGSGANMEYGGRRQSADGDEGEDEDEAMETRKGEAVRLLQTLDRSSLAQMSIALTQLIRAKAQEQTVSNADDSTVFSQ
jgi:hypothetical protein